MTNNRKSKFRASFALLGGASTLALAMGAAAQDGAAATTEPDDVILVTGIRGSLQQAMDVKRNSDGIVDAISAEDIGKFPDTNLAESLQRITGVSIDRQNGEGSRVTVRGFGPDYNLVLLNGRQMPTSSLQATSASASRSFDFGNIASEGISAVEVYKTSRASIPTGGIGSTINIRTARPLDAPGMHASFGGKALTDFSRNGGASVTPEISGIYSNTFSDDVWGVALSGSYQERKSSFNQVGATSGWRGAYLGADNNWGTLPQIPSGGTEADINTTNRPGPTDVYSVPQNLNYNINDIDRKRINGQAVLQFHPVDSFTTTLDYTFSQNRIAQRTSDLSVWFNFADITSEWTDGPIVGPLYYSEDFPESGPTDLSMGGAQFASKSINHSFGANMEWSPTDRLSMSLDFHSSSAESKEDSPFGSNATLGTACFCLTRQSIDFSQDIPVLNLGFLSGQNGIDASLHLGTGSSFRNSYMKTEITQLQYSAKYEFDDAIVDSIDFGASYTDNKVRSAFSNVQNDTWGGVGSPADYPDDLFTRVSLVDYFDQFKASKDPNMQQDIFLIDFNRLVDIMNTLPGGLNCVDGVCRSDDFTTDRRTKEQSYAAFLQFKSSFDIGVMPATLVAGVRYEKTDVESKALVPIPVGTQWVANNEYGLIFSTDQDFTELTGKYEYWLPSADFSLNLTDNLIARLSYGKTITRPGYDQIQGGQTVNQLFRVDGGDGNQGDPGLLPFESDNLDASVEWYYDKSSYLAAGFFYKWVDNFIGTTTIQDTPFSLPHPYGGQRYMDAVAALGGSSDLAAIRQWIFENADPSTFEITGTDGGGNYVGNIFGVPGEDPLVVFDISVPVNQRSAAVHGFEFALQHVLGDTGFGAILNYTIVQGDVDFDNTQPAAVAQFALVGLSDSANIIGFYDKNGIQVRVAYNWRDKFLNSTNNASGEPNNPMYTEPYGQVDFSASYELTEGLTLFAEGINVLNNTQRIHGRHENVLHFATQGGARYGFGLRYKF